jgi:hypothetical protein
VAWGIQSGGVSSSSGFNLSLYLESRATPGISASLQIFWILMGVRVSSFGRFIPGNDWVGLSAGIKKLWWLAPEDAGL